MLKPEVPKSRDAAPFDNGTIETLREGEVSLDFLQNEPKTDYLGLIREAESNVFKDERALRADYSEIWKPYDTPGIPGKKEVISKIFDVALPGSILCDLGGYNGKTEYLAAGHNASMYINVDRYPRGLNDSTPVDSQKGQFGKADYVDVTGQTFIEGIHNVVTVRADMLDFVSRIRDGSVNVTVNGIDADVIPIEKYHESLATEILRVTKHQGVIFGHGSYPLLRDIIKLIEQNSELINEFQIVYNAEGTVVVWRK
jgi:hypothetical protein